MKQTYKTNNNIVYSCKYHVVWCPKYRRKVLIGEVETRLKKLIIEVCADINVDIIKIEIMPNYVYMFLEAAPKFGVHKAIKQIKSKTSRVLRNEFHHLKTKIPTLWTNSYFISTVEEVPVSAIKQYIESQKTSQRT